MQKAKILLYDLETSPNIGYTWAKYEQNVIAFSKEWEILSFAFKWHGSTKVHCYTRQDFKDKTDKSLCKKLYELFEEADILVAHNGNSFDQKKALARFIYHGFKPLKKLTSIDTKLVAKRYFNFNSNSLTDLGQYLKLGKKLNTGGFDLWLGCMAGNKESWKTMKKYNIQDVVLLDKVFNRLRPWIQNHPSLSLLMGNKPNSGCPTCGSVHVIKRGIRANHRSIQQQMQCKDCNGWFLIPMSKKK